MPCLRHRSSTFAPASASFSTAMICSSLNRFFFTSAPFRLADSTSEPYYFRGARHYGAAEPTTDSDRALVAGYWYQFVEGQEDFGSQTINSDLKHLGHGVSNITKALERLKS